MYRLHLPEVMQGKATIHEKVAETADNGGQLESAEEDVGEN